MVIDIARKAQELFSKYIAAYFQLDKKYFDLAFFSAANANKAAKKVFIVRNHFFLTIKTYYAKDKKNLLALIRFLM